MVMIRTCQVIQVLANMIKLTKKIFIYSIIFFLLLTLNFVIGKKLLLKKERLVRQQRILDEIVDITQLQNQFSQSAKKKEISEIQTAIETNDARSSNLKAFFRKYNSPLYDHAEYIVKVSDEYQFDYRLLPAIAMQESNLCKYTPENSYNCWGWGIYGTLVTRFSSYEEAIDTVSKGIKKEYIDKGLLTTSAIMEKYTPPSTGSWANGVNHFLRMLE